MGFHYRANQQCIMIPLQKQSGFLETGMTRQPKKLLDQVRACPATVGRAEGVQYGRRAVAGEYTHHSSSTEGTCVYCAKRLISITTSDNRWRWVRRKSASFSPTWQ